MTPSFSLVGRSVAFVLATVAILALPVASSSAANSVLAPPASTFVPALGGASPGAPCDGAVLCVGASGDFGTITAAIDAAASGNTIQVQAGTYPERVAVAGKTVTLLGGFVAGFTTRDPAAHPTVIDGQGAGTTVSLNDAGASVVDGFTVTGGRAPLDADRGARGSGINVVDSGAVTIRNNIIEGNDDGQNFNNCNCQTLGGGISAGSYLPGSSITIAGNIIRDNRAHRGAGISIGVPALIEGNLIEDNHAGGDHGGGLYLSAQTMTVRRNLVRGNTIGAQAGYGWGGGGIFYGPGKPRPKASFEANRWIGNRAPGPGSGLFIDDDATGRITGDLFHDNACGAGGSALYVDGTGVVPTGSTATLENVTIADNVCPAGSRGTGIFTEGGSRIKVTNSIITANGGSSEIFVCTRCARGLPRPRASTITFSLIGGRAVHVKRGAGVLGGDPGFLDSAADDFHLAVGSRAIDRGNPRSAVGAEPAPNGGRRNLGAYGGSEEATPSSG